MKSLRTQISVFATLLLGSSTLSWAAKIPHEIYPATENEAPPALTLEEPTKIKEPAPIQSEATPAVASKKRISKRAAKKLAKLEKSPLTKRVEALEEQLKDLQDKMTATAAAAATEIPEPTTQADEKASAYDTVPGEQTDSILKRLKLAEELVRKYGRAYDYRTHTTQSLQAILNGLKSAPSTGPLPAPKEMEPKDPATEEDSKAQQLRAPVSTL